MNQIVDLIRQFFGFFKVWIIVSPWEQAVRVRLGKRVELLSAGVHLRIPIADSIYLQSTRMRISATGRQTLLCSDGKTVTISTSIGYEIRDLETVCRRLHHAEDTIRNLVLAVIANDVGTHRSEEITSVKVEERVWASLEALAMSRVFTNRLRTYGGMSATEVFVEDTYVAIPFLDCWSLREGGVEFRQLPRADWSQEQVDYLLEVLNDVAEYYKDIAAAASDDDDDDDGENSF